MLIGGIGVRIGTFLPGSPGCRIERLLNMASTAQLPMNGVIACNRPGADDQVTFTPPVTEMGGNRLVGVVCEVGGGSLGVKQRPPEVLRGERLAGKCKRIGLIVLRRKSASGVAVPGIDHLQ